jgi:hypothetical protein
MTEPQELDESLLYDLIVITKPITHEPIKLIITKE